MKSIIFLFCLLVFGSYALLESDIGCCHDNAEKIQNLLQRVSALEKQLKHTKSTSQEAVAFFAELSSDMTNPAKGQTVVFDQLLTNVGNAYDPKTGVFTAPVTGIYHFNVVASSPSNSNPNHFMHLFLYKNSMKIAYLFLDRNTDYWIHTSASTVVEAAKGDRIWVETGLVGGNHVLAGHKLGEGEIHTHISGFLIQKL